MNTLSSTKSLRNKAMEVFSAPFRMLTAFMLYLGTLPMALMPTHCVTIKGNIDMDSLFGNMADIVIKMAFYVGVIIAISGIFSLVLAYKDDNSEGQTRAIRLIIVGVMLVGFETVLKLAGIVG